MTDTRLELDPRLGEFATEAQWQKMEAWARLGSARAAAEELGCNKRAVELARDGVVRKATAAGYIQPEESAFHMKDKVPAGFMLKGQSASVGADGKLQSRWDKTKRAGMDPQEAYQPASPMALKKLSTMTDSEGQVVVQWRTEAPELVNQEKAWQDFAACLSESVTRLEPLPAPEHTAKGAFTLYPVGDHHLGMLAWGREVGVPYDLDIGKRLLQKAFSYLSASTMPTSVAVLAFMGDFLHYDGYESVTPTGHNQLDSDTRFPKMIWAAVELMRGSIDMALRVHDEVHVIVEPGNHDLASSIFLALCLKIAYEQEPRVKIDTSPAHFHYFRFEKVLLGTHHGHGVKMENLPLLMAVDRPEDWGATTYRYIKTGHVHHKSKAVPMVAKDFPGCEVESVRILPPPDAWAHQKGYRAIRDMQSITYHGQFGEMARRTVNPAMLEEA